MSRDGSIGVGQQIAASGGPSRAIPGAAVPSTVPQPTRTMHERVANLEAICQMQADQIMTLARNCNVLSQLLDEARHNLDLSPCELEHIPTP